MNENAPRLAILDWDSEHFRFPVARIDAGPAEVACLLAQARTDGFQLVYWNGPAEFHLPVKLLQQFAGTLVEQKCTLECRLDAPAPGRGDNRIREWPAGSPSETLVQLALAAGDMSRFRVDTRFPPPLFESMYRVWIERSTRREIADVVLIATDGDDLVPLGLVTVASKGGIGQIGLLAVDRCARGRGLGAALVDAAHGFMAGRGCEVARVVTQGANETALRLYRRAGYRDSERISVYQFWPQAS